MAIQFKINSQSVQWTDLYSVPSYVYVGVSYVSVSIVS